MAPITTYLLHNSKSIAGTYLGGRGNLATEYHHHHHQHSNHRSMRLHVEKHRVIMIHLMVRGNIGDDIDDSYAWKGGSNLLHTRHFSHFIMYTMSIASVLPPNSGR